MHKVQRGRSGDYSLNSPHSGAYGASVRPVVRQGHAPGPWPPAATLGDVQLSQTLTGLSAREREVSPTPVIPTRRVVVRHSPCTPWQPVRLGPKRGPSPLWTHHGKDHSPSVPAPCPASPTVDRGRDHERFRQMNLRGKSGGRLVAARNRHSCQAQHPLCHSTIKRADPRKLTLGAPLGQSDMPQGARPTAMRRKRPLQNLAKHAWLSRQGR